MTEEERIAIDVAIHNGYFLRDRLAVPVDVVVYPAFSTYMALRKAGVEKELIKTIGETTFKAYPIDLNAYLLSAYITGRQVEKRQANT